ncbi:PIN domain-containing protein [Methylomagnum sp.]
MGRVNYLLDTNILSEPLATRPNPLVETRLRMFADALAISAVTWQEMLFGMNRLPPSRRRQIEEYLRNRIEGIVPILAFDARAAEWLAAERARLLALGLPRAYYDSQIAAIAAVNGLVIVTRNVDDFAGFEGLWVENWFEP